MAGRRPTPSHSRPARACREPSREEEEAIPSTSPPRRAPNRPELTDSSPQGFRGTATPLGGGFEQITTLIGCPDGGTLTGRETASTWSLDDNPTYSDGTNTLEFENFPDLQGGGAGNVFDILGDANGQVTANLIGGGGDDLYRFHGFAQLVGRLEGQAGFDTLSYADFGSAVAVRLSGSDATGYQGNEDSTFSGGGFQGIDSLIASPRDDGPSILRGEDVASTWSLGQVPTYSDGSARALAFFDFGILLGGDRADTFIIAAGTTANLAGGAGDDRFAFAIDGVVLHGSIDGQDGRNLLDLGGYLRPTRIDLEDGTASMVEGGIAHIRDVRGGAGADTLIGDDADNSLVGNGGSDQLAGGAGG